MSDFVYMPITVRTRFPKPGCDHGEREIWALVAGSWAAHQTVCIEMCEDGGCFHRDVWTVTLVENGMCLPLPKMDEMQAINIAVMLSNEVFGTPTEVLARRADIARICSDVLGVDVMARAGVAAP